MSSYQLSEEQDPLVDPGLLIVVEDTDAGEIIIDPTSSLSDQQAILLLSPGSRPPSPRPPSTRSPSPSRSAEPTSDTEVDAEDMATRLRNRSNSGSRRLPGSARAKIRTDDWTEVTEPEERRRIQNRIAQRKFREKVREQRERSERESRNQEHAGSSYHIPDASELVEEEELSGLPWGSLSMGHVLTKGHESESRRGSRRESEQRPDDAQLLAPYPTITFDQVASYDGQESSGDDRYYQDSPYYYDLGAGGGGDPPLPQPQM